MFNKLPDLFDRNFAIGYALPAALFIGASLRLLTALGLQNIVTPNATFDTLLGTTLIVLLGLLVAVLLLMVNRDLYRILEGYRWGRLKLFRKLTQQQRNRFNALVKDVEHLKNQRAANRQRDEPFPPTLADQLRTKQEQLVLHFPHEEDFILPTSFGNTIRAFEVYATVMYGIDTIHGWNRLLAVVPKDYLALVDSAKAATDFWINFFYLGLLFIMESIGLLLYTERWGLSWVPFITITIVILSYMRATRAAIEWGDLFKAAFDVFLPELAKKLQFDQSTSEGATQQLWNGFSQAIVFRSPGSLPARTAAISPPVLDTSATVSDSVSNAPSTK